MSSQKPVTRAPPSMGNRVVYNTRSFKWVSQPALLQVAVVTSMLGAPDTVLMSQNGLVAWHQALLNKKKLFGFNVCFSEVMVQDSDILHRCPYSHIDCVTVSIPLDLDSQQRSMLEGIGGTVVYDPMRKYLMCCCGNIGMCTATLRVAVDCLVANSLTNVVQAYKQSLANTVSANPATANINIDVFKADYISLCTSLSKLTQDLSRTGFWRGATTQDCLPSSPLSDVSQLNKASTPPGVNASAIAKMTFEDGSTDSDAASVHVNSAVAAREGMMIGRVDGPTQVPYVDFMAGRYRPASATALARAGRQSIAAPASGGTWGQAFTGLADLATSAFGSHEGLEINSRDSVSQLASIDQYPVRVGEITNSTTRPLNVRWVSRTDSSGSSRLRDASREGLAVEPIRYDGHKVPYFSRTEEGFSAQLPSQVSVQSLADVDNVTERRGICNGGYGACDPSYQNAVQEAASRTRSGMPFRPVQPSGRPMAQFARGSVEPFTGQVPANQVPATCQPNIYYGQTGGTYGAEADGRFLAKDQRGCPTAWSGRPNSSYNHGRGNLGYAATNEQFVQRAYSVAGRVPNPNVLGISSRGTSI